MANTHKTIADYEGLERSRNEGRTTSLDEIDFLMPFTGPTTAEEWHDGQISKPRLPRPISELHGYAYNSRKKAYVVFYIFLGHPGELPGQEIRHTEMRMWEMITDSWITTGNAPDSLRYVAFSDIINMTVRGLIEEEWAHQESLAADDDGTGGGGGQREFGIERQRMLTITPTTGARTWNRNPFIRSGVRVATALSTASRSGSRGRTVTCVKAHLIRRDEVEMDMVLEFKNGEPGQETYREELVRRAEPMVAHNVEQKQAARAAGREWENLIFLPPRTLSDSEKASDGSNSASDGSSNAASHGSGGASR